MAAHAQQRIKRDVQAECHGDGDWGDPAPADAKRQEQHDEKYEGSEEEPECFYRECVEDQRANHQGGVQRHSWLAHPILEFHPSHIALFTSLPQQHDTARRHARAYQGGKQSRTNTLTCRCRKRPRVEHDGTGK
jgi:hypothetical protein